MITITVYGTPQTAGSKKGFVIKPKNGGKPRAVVTEDNTRSGPWKKEVAQEAGKVMAGRDLLRGPLEATLVFYRKRPKGHFGRRGLLPSADPYPITKPDLLKYTRAAEDALTGVVWHDDAQIVDEVLRKRYGEPERVEISVQAITLPPPPETLDQAQTSLLPDPRRVEELPV